MVIRGQAASLPVATEVEKSEQSGETLALGPDIIPLGNARPDELSGEATRPDAHPDEVSWIFLDPSGGVTLTTLGSRRDRCAAALERKAEAAAKARIVERLAALAGPDNEAGKIGVSS